MFTTLRRYAFLAGLSLPLAAIDVARAATTPEEALALKPLQADVDYERPDKADIAKCTVDAENVGGVSGYVVKHSSGRLLARGCYDSPRLFCEDGAGADTGSDTDFVL